MSPSVLLEGFILFLISLALHILIWRRRVPSNQVLVFLILFLFPVPFIAAYSLSFAGLFHWENFLAALLLYLALGTAYVQSYPTCQALSPSLQILLLIGSAGSTGLGETEIRERFGSKALLGDRIRDLLQSALVRSRGEQLEITPKGRLLLFPGILLRKGLGLPLGKG